MMEKLSKMFRTNSIKHQRIHILQIRGTIDTSMTYKISKSLKKFKGKNSKALALIINSQGGSPAQAYMILQRINHIKKKFNIPLYTFAEDYALSSAFMLHQAGDKRFCDHTTLLGKVGTQVVQTKLYGLLDKMNIEVRNFSTSEQSFSRQIDWLSKTEPNNDLQSVNDYANQVMKGVFKDMFTTNKPRMNESEYQELLEGQIFQGSKALEFGLCDQIVHYTDVLKADFPGTKLEYLIQKTKKEKAIEFFQSFTTQVWSDLLSGVVGVATKRL